MSEELEQKLLNQIKQLQKEMREIKGIDSDDIPTYQYSKISFSTLKQLVNIKQNINQSVFDEWFSNDVSISNETVNVFEELISNNELLIESYSEEDLKINFISPILNRVNFKSYENEFRDFYELPMVYKTEKFIFNGTVDFTISKGLIESEKPYFFIQEFKKGKQNSYPESQLLAELISGVELNSWSEIKGAYIVGSLWYFVILQKLDNEKYQYFVSKKLDSIRIEDLKVIYRNLVYIKNEIIKKIDK